MRGVIKRVVMWLYCRDLLSMTAAARAFRWFRLGPH